MAQAYYEAFTSLNRVFIPMSEAFGAQTASQVGRRTNRALGSFTLVALYALMNEGVAMVQD